MNGVTGRMGKNQHLLRRYAEPGTPDEAERDEYQQFWLHTATIVVDEVLSNDQDVAERLSGVEGLSEATRPAARGAGSLHPPGDARR